MRYENTGATESSEDYLEAILVIRAERGFCRNVDIAERLGVTRPSVTKALANLSSRSLVEVAGRDVRLTPEGRRLAGATLEKHEFFRRLLRAITPLPGRPPRSLSRAPSSPCASGRTHPC